MVQPSRAISLHSPRTTKITVAADIIIFGTIWGAIYTILALGFTLIFGVARILNLAYGAMYLVASYLIYSRVSGLKLAAIPACSIAVAATRSTGVARYPVVIVPVGRSLGRLPLVKRGL